MKPRPNYFAGAGSIIWLLIVLVPIYVMVTATIQTQQGYASAGPLSLPSSFTRSCQGGRGGKGQGKAGEI